VWSKQEALTCAGPYADLCSFLRRLTGAGANLSLSRFFLTSALEMRELAAARQGAEGRERCRGSELGSGAVGGSAGPAKRDGEPRLLSKESERRGVLFISEIV